MIKFLPKQKIYFCCITILLPLLLFPYKSQAFQNKAELFTFFFLKSQIAQSGANFLTGIDEPADTEQLGNKKQSSEASPENRNGSNDDSGPRQESAEETNAEDKIFKDTSNGKEKKPDKPLDSIVTHGLSSDTHSENREEQPDSPIDSIVTHGISNFE